MPPEWYCDIEITNVEFSFIGPRFPYRCSLVDGRFDPTGVRLIWTFESVAPATQVIHRWPSAIGGGTSQIWVEWSPPPPWAPMDASDMDAHGFLLTRERRQRTTFAATGKIPVLNENIHQPGVISIEIGERHPGYESHGTATQFRRIRPLQQPG